MNPTYIEIFQKITQDYQDLNLQDYQKKYKGDDEFKKIARVKKIAKSELQNNDKTTLLNKIKKIINETKNIHKDSLTSTKKQEIAVQEKERVINENTKLQKKIQVLETFRQSSIASYNEKEEQYNKIVDEEKAKKTAVVEGFQKEIQEIQTKMEQVATFKQNSEAENSALKEKIKEINKHMEDRDKLFDEQLKQLDISRKERETKIKESLDSFTQNFVASDKNADEELLQIKEDEAILDTHLNAYMQKSDEFKSMIEKTNQQFELYKSETNKLSIQCRQFEQKSLEFQRKCEKTDIYIVEQAKEHFQLQEQVKLKEEQLGQLQNLLQSLQMGHL